MPADFPVPGGREGTGEKEKTVHVKGHVGGDRSSLFHVKADLARPAHAPVSGDATERLRPLAIRGGRLTIQTLLRNVVRKRKDRRKGRIGEERVEAVMVVGIAGDVRLEPLRMVLGRATVKPVEYRVNELLDGELERRRLGFGGTVAGRVLGWEIVEFVVLFVVVLDCRWCFDNMGPLFDMVFYRWCCDDIELLYNLVDFE